MHVGDIIPYIGPIRTENLFYSKVIIVNVSQHVIHYQYSYLFDWLKNFKPPPHKKCRS